MHDVFVFIAGMLMPLVMGVVVEACDWIRSKIRRGKDEPYAEQNTRRT